MTLKSALYACMLCAFVVLGILVLLVLPNFSRDLTGAALEREIQTRTSSLALELSRNLHADWQQLNDLSEEIGEMDPDMARVFLDGVTTGGTISWSGFATVDGTVRAASGGLLEGQSVAARPWFSAGLTGAFAGDVHEAVLLQSLLAPEAETPLRFIDLARPVVDAGGRTIGVVGFHIDAAWLEAYLAEAAAIRGIDVVLVSADGTPAISTVALGDDPSSIAAIRAAGAGAAGRMIEDWPDGQRSISAVVTNMTYEDLPSFGWRIVGRIPTDSFAFAQTQLLRHVLALGGAAAAVFVLAALVFVTVFLRPLTGLIATAERISLGEDAYPVETTSSSEAARLGTALSRLRSARDPDGPNG